MKTKDHKSKRQVAEIESKIASKKLINDIIDLKNQSKEELLLKMMEELPQYIEQRKIDFIKTLDKYKINKAAQMQEMIDNGTVWQGEKTIPVMNLTDICFRPFVKCLGTSPKYSTDEISIIFDYFKEATHKINEFELFIPTKENFCSLLNISTSSFNDYKNNGTKEMREICNQLEDFVANWLSQASLQRKIDNSTAIYLQKSSLGRKEATDQPPPNSYNTLIIGSDEDFKKLARKYNY